MKSALQLAAAQEILSGGFGTPGPKVIWTPTKVNNLFTVSQEVMPAPGEDCYWVPFRSVLRRLPGTAYTVGALVNLKVGVLGTTLADIHHHEINPTQLGAGKYLDGIVEAIYLANGPAFSWTGAAQSMNVFNVDGSWLNKPLVAHTVTGNITGGSGNLHFQVWAHRVRVR